MTEDSSDTCGAAPKPKLSRRRRWLFRLILAIVAPLVVLGLTEGILRLAGAGYPTGYFIRVRGQDAYTSNPRFGWRFFPRQLSREPRPIYVPAEKGPDVFRIFVMGGSAAQGVPGPSFSFSRILEVMLADAFPETRFEVFNVGMTAINSHVVLPIARDCAALEPDLYIVYMGNNEIRGPFGVGTAYQDFSPNLSAIRAAIGAKKLRLAQLVERLAGAMSGGQSGSPHQWRGMEMNLANHVAADDPRLTKLFEHFRTNVEDICQAGLDAEAEVLLCTVGVNLKDCPPFGSTHRRGLTEADLAAWDEAFQAGVQAEDSGAIAEALEHYTRAAAIDDRYAELQYRLGRCCLAEERLDEAGDALRLARDLDVLRFRTDSRLNGIIREVADQLGDRGVHLVDAERAFAAAAKTPGLPGDDLLYEHVHMTFAGNYQLARAAFARIVASESLVSELGASPPESLSEGQCAERLVLTPWKQEAMLQYIIMMTSRPPFVGQVDNEKRVAAWRALLAEATAQQTEARASQTRLDYLAALERRPGDIEMRYDFGRFLLNDLRRYDQAEQQFRLVLERLPELSRYVLRLAFALQAQGKASEAAEAFRRAVDLSPRPARIATMVAGAYLRANQAAEALEWSEEALAEEPELADALRIAGGIYAAQERFDQAADALGKYLAQDPQLGARELADLHCTLATCLTRSDRAAEGREQLTRAIEAAPDYARPHMLLAGASAETGEFRQALQHYHGAVAAEPTNGPARQALVMLLATCADPGVRDPAAAVEQAVEGVRLRQAHDLTSWYVLAVAYAENGQFDLAVEYIDMAITGDGWTAHPTQITAWRRQRDLFAAGISLTQQRGGP